MKDDETNIFRLGWLTKREMRKYLSLYGNRNLLFKNRNKLIELCVKESSNLLCTKTHMINLIKATRSWNELCKPRVRVLDDKFVWTFEIKGKTVVMCGY